MLPRPRILPLLVATLLSLNLAGIGRAIPAEWTDADGSHFTGEPLAVFGSLALFRTNEPLVRRVPLRSLSPEDCQRLHHALAQRPARADQWPEATGRLTRELLGRSLRLEPQYRKFIPFEFAGRPEPQLVIALYGSTPDLRAWGMANNFIPAHDRIQAVYPGVTATVFYELAPGSEETLKITRDTWASWLVADPARKKELPLLASLAPKDGPRILALTRDGEVLLSADPQNLAASREFVDSLAGLLWAANPANNRAWAGLAHYGRAVRPLEFAQGTTGPRLVGNPFRADGLRQRGVGRVAARLEVGADGKVTAATLSPGSVVPEKMAAPLAAALRQSAIFLPAIDRGVPIAAAYDFVFEVPPANARADADAAWLDGGILGEVPLQDWKILKTIPVNQREFDEVQGTGPDGRVILRALEVTSAKVSRASQLSAFHSDWFGESGASGVRPVDGQTQVVDGLTLTWRAVEADNGFVDLQWGEIPPRDYCVGYAWTEIEVSADTDAWLGVGSDDGLKLWHNGVLVKDAWVPRYSKLDSDIVPLRLTRGKNQLLLKIQNVTGNWSFITRLRFRDR